MGVSRAAHTQYAYIWKYPPPPRARPSPRSVTSLPRILLSYRQWNIGHFQRRSLAKHYEEYHKYI